MLVIEPIMVYIFWAHRPISFKPMFFWCPCLDPHLTTYYLNKAIQLILCIVIRHIYITNNWYVFVLTKLHSSKLRLIARLVDNSYKYIALVGLGHCLETDNAYGKSIVDRHWAWMPKHYSQSHIQCWICVGGRRSKKFKMLVDQYKGPTKPSISVE